MESERVFLRGIHEHSMVPWNHMGKGDCCGRIEAITDGYYCDLCKFFFHKKCSESSEYIQHPSHSGHTLQLRRNLKNYCNLCGKNIKNLFYRCEQCDFDIDLHCSRYPPPEVIDNSKTHQHKLTLLKEWTDLDCDAKCGKPGNFGYAYKCGECNLVFHMDCVWHPLEVKHPLEYTTLDAGERVSLPWIHTHFMMPWNNLRKGDCCGRFKAISDGYYCVYCDFFVHKKCGDKSPEYIQHPSHSLHPLWLQITSGTYCDMCGKTIVDLSYSCKICHFDIDLHCVKYQPPEVIENSETHHHKLTLLKERVHFDCDARCGKIGEDEFSYACLECDLAFHVGCVWHPPKVKNPLELNHSYHLLHPLKLLINRLPDYGDGKCRLCGSEIDDRLFYHCSSCNFTLDMRCVLHPPPQNILYSKTHDHQLTLLPRLVSFTCNVCGLNGDRSPYQCVQCDFMIHQDCLELPGTININRHDHRISRTSVLGVVNSVCGVCRKKVDWTCGGYSCERCPGNVFHSKCSTSKDVWNGKELEGVLEEIEDIEPYVVINENTIQHFSHEEHYLRLHVNGVMYDESNRCRACSQPICLQSFYGCIDCDFILHQNCAEFRKRKWHVLYNEKLTLFTSKGDWFVCDACDGASNGFVYQHGEMELDVGCGSISEPFVHPSHPHHPLFYFPQNNKEVCNGCNCSVYYVLRCIEDGCEFLLCFKCATLPQVVKHKVDDHPLSLCYGGEEASGKYWCDICEKETNPKLWFYTCKDHQASLHTECVLGDFAKLTLRSTLKYLNEFEVGLNNGMTRPLCRGCNSRCMYPNILKKLGTSDTYVCSFKCRGVVMNK